MAYKVLLMKRKFCSLFAGPQCNIFSPFFSSLSLEFKWSLLLLILEFVTDCEKLRWKPGKTVFWDFLRALSKVTAVGLAFVLEGFKYFFVLNFLGVFEFCLGEPDYCS